MSSCMNTWVSKSLTNIIYLTVRNLQFREILQLRDETVIIGCKWMAPLQWQDLQIRVQVHNII